MPSTNNKKSFSDHFFELKNRLIKILCIFLFFFIVSYLVVDDIFAIMVRPLTNIESEHERKIIYTGLTEAFLTYINIAFFSSILATIPFVSYHVYKFISPGLYEYERKVARGIIFAMPSLFFAGVFFVYYIVMPKAWEFFLHYETSNKIYQISLEAKISEYISLVTTLIIAFGVAFELPVFILILVLMRLISGETLKKYRRVAIIIVFIIAGIITPPDVISQLALAIPMVLMYEITIFITKKIESRRINA